MKRDLLACVTCVGAVVLVASAVALIASQQTPASRVFTAQQATTGRAAYQESCATCHMPDLRGNEDAPPLAGKNFASTWAARSTKDLYEYMSAAMPPGERPRTAETYLAITAYILQSNGAIPGPEALSASTAVPIGRLAPAGSMTNDK